ncbi:MAG: hypothetical protein ACMXYD_04810 [Candidatus Woesearchaeota archaeon]
MNKQTLLLLLLFLFVAFSQQQLLVTVEFSQEQATIRGYEWIEAPDTTRQTGEYLLQLRDQQNNLVSQTSFSPYMILGTGERMYVEEMTIPIRAPAGVKTIELLNQEGDVIATQPIASYCGDGLCEEHERGVCPLDCAPEAVEEVTTVYEEPLVEIRERNLAHYALITAAAILILALIALLIHLNKNKPREEEPSNQYQY